MECGSSAYNAQRSVKFDMLFEEFESTFPELSPDAYSASVAMRLGAFNRTGWADTWHVERGPQLIFMDDGTGNGDPCNDLPGYTEINAPHPAGAHDSCTAAVASESWQVYVR